MTQRQERRGEQRFRVRDLAVTLVGDGADGPVRHRGHLVEVSGGGATVELDRAPGSTRAGPVLVVHTAQQDLMVLTGPLTTTVGSKTTVRLRFRPPVVPDPEWSAFIAGLPGGR